MGRRKGVATSKKRKMEEVDEFDKLPNDLILDILSGFNDAKFLTQTLGLVNKRFASLILTHVTSVSTDINNPPPNPKFNKSIDSSIRVHYSLFTTTNPPPPPPLSTAAKFRPLQYCPEIPPCNYFARKAREKLHGFTGLQKAVIEYPYFEDMFGFGLFDRPMKWKLEYSSGGGIKSCAVLGANAMLGGSVSSITLNHDNTLSINRRLDWLSKCFKFAHRFRPMVVQMARDHQYLGDITITNNKRPRAWIHAGEQELIKMRDDNGSSSSSRSMHMKVKFWHIPVIELSSGFHITAATFMVATDEINDDEIINEAARRFWGGYHGPQEEFTTQNIQEVETKMTALVAGNNSCAMQINTIWDWTGRATNPRRRRLL